MKNRTLMGLIASATIGTAIAIPAMIDNQNTSHFVNKVLMINNTNSSLTNEAVVINGNSSMNLYALSNGIGIVSRISIGEMLTILGQAQNGYCKVKVQETGAVGYINIGNMQNILNGTNDTFTQLSGNGQVVNVSSNVRLRSNPSIGNNNIIGHLTNGTNLNIFGKQGQWYKVSVNGQIGFIYEEYVNINTINSNSKSTTNNININSGNTNISTTNSSNSNFISNTNSNNHMKNTIVRAKRSATSNSLSNINNSKNLGIKSNTSGSYLETVNKICYIVPKPGMILSQAEMNSAKYVNSKLSNGTQVLVFKKTSNLPSGWVKVTVQDGVTGYLPISDINTTNTSNEKNKIGSNIQHASGLDTHVNNMSNALITSQNNSNNSASRITSKSKVSDSLQTNNNSNRKINEYKQNLHYNNEQLTLYENKLKQEEENLKVIPEKAVQEQKQKINLLNETLKNMQSGINKTKQGISNFNKQINLYNQALIYDNNQLSKVKKTLKRQEARLANMSGTNKQEQIKKIDNTKNLIKNMESGIIKTKQAIVETKENIKKYNESLVYDNNIFSSEQMKLIQAENGLKSTYVRAKVNEINKINNTKKIIQHIENKNKQIEKEIDELQ